MKIIKVVAVLGLALLGASQEVQADTRAQLRSRLNRYFQDSTNSVYDTTVKNQVLNIALLEYTASWPVQIDTARQVLDSGVRLYALPANCGGIITSMHKNDDKFTEVKEVPTDSIPASELGVVQYYSVKGRRFVVYPKPTSQDSVFYFYNRVSPTLDSANHECELANWLEEPIVLLAASKLWLMTDLRMDLANSFYQQYEREAARLLRVLVEEPRKP